MTILLVFQNDLERLEEALRLEWVGHRLLVVIRYDIVTGLFPSSVATSPVVSKAMSPGIEKNSTIRG
jgi:hypothetical protein